MFFITLQKVIAINHCTNISRWTFVWDIRLGQVWNLAFVHSTVLIWMCSLPCAVWSLKNTACSGSVQCQYKVSCVGCFTHSSYWPFGLQCFCVCLSVWLWTAAPRGAILTITHQQCVVLFVFFYDYPVGLSLFPHGHYINYAYKKTPNF